MIAHLPQFMILFPCSLLFFLFFFVSYISYPLSIFASVLLSGLRFYKIEIHVVDGTLSASFVIIDREASRFIGKSAIDLKFIGKSATDLKFIGKSATDLKFIGKSATDLKSSFDEVSGDNFHEQKICFLH
ncbi:hypothetical protein M5689_024737 [Euphorbia peplus]|nr:hypothetical protein M5689_024737 [Euphorbia peplus]